jgi:hypothetical protein
VGGERGVKDRAAGCGGAIGEAVDREAANDEQVEDRRAWFGSHRSIIGP